MNNSIYKVFKYRVNPKAIFELFKNTHMPFLLESSADIKGMGRYSFIGSDPFLVFNSSESDGHSLDALRELLKRYEIKNCKSVSPFLCGAVGFFSYDFGFSLEEIKRKNKSDAIVPDVLFGFYDLIIGCDHYKNEIFVFSSGFPERGALRSKRARKRLDETVSKLKKLEGSPIASACDKNFLKAKLTSNFSKKDYEAVVRRAQHYISIGDIYQVNIAQKFSSEFQGDSWQLYKRLVKNFPVSFSAFFSASDFTIISASPEKFLSFDGKNVVTRPMKGTCKRTCSSARNLKLKSGLIQSAKEKAELLMIVDLERNDLGRVCDYGSIRVKSLREIELYKSVFQATAEVTGVLHKGKDRLDLIRACFPGGSVTGCPKIRAMEIIEELEPSTRSIYTGSLGFLSFHNTMELNILIRSFLRKQNEISFHVGGGIVADSKPSAEYEETLIKADVLMKALAREVVK